MSLSIDSKNIKLLLCNPNIMIWRKIFLDASYKTIARGIATILESPESATSQESVHKLYKILDCLDWKGPRKSMF